MVRKAEWNSAVDSRQVLVACQKARCPLLPAFVLGVILAFASSLMAESLASKNREGNRLFAQGKYEDAEKAYLEAQAKNPGKPEILYNLGNSLIKQKKYDQGVQSLRQSIEKGNKETKKNSWYNTGNALFNAGSFKDSAESYIRALKLDPADKDAKHNLELALIKLNEQQQKQANANQNQQNSQKQNQDKPSSGKEGQQQKDRNESSRGKEQKNQARSQATQEAAREGSISKEQAAQILDAIRNQELEQQRKLLDSLARRSSNGKDW